MIQALTATARWGISQRFSNNKRTPDNSHHDWSQSFEKIKKVQSIRGRSRFFFAILNLRNGNIMWRKIMRITEGAKNYRFISRALAEITIYFICKIRNFDWRFPKFLFFTFCLLSFGYLCLVLQSVLILPVNLPGTPGQRTLKCTYRPNFISIG